MCQELSRIFIALIFDHYNICENVLVSCCQDVLLIFISLITTVIITVQCSAKLSTFCGSFAHPCTCLLHSSSESVDLKFWLDNLPKGKKG